MITEPDLMLERIDGAMQRQSWKEAWVLLEEANPDYQTGDRHLGARRQDFIMMAAHCLRHRGQLDKSGELYDLLLGEIALNDSRLAEALMGKADLLHMQGDIGSSIQLLRVAAQVPGQSGELSTRVATAASHIIGHQEIGKAIDNFQATLSRAAGVSGSVKANLHFLYGDALLTAGRYEESEEQLQIARSIAQAESCAVTLADTLRRLPLVAALQGSSSHSLDDLTALNNARTLYRSAGDRGEAYLYTESGEVNRSLGKIREAESEFSRGLWAAREIDDPNRIGHNQMGLFEISRQALRPKRELLDNAEAAYQKARSDWGLVQVLISRALVDRAKRTETVAQAKDFIQESRFSDFRSETQLLDWIRTAPEDRLEQELHLMNYP